MALIKNLVFCKNLLFFNYRVFFKIVVFFIATLKKEGRRFTKYI